MTGAVFTETLRRKWRQMVYWGVGIGVYAFYPFLMLPSDAKERAEVFQGYIDLMEKFDNSMLRALGVEDAAFLGSPEGFIGYGFFGFMLLVLAIYVVLAGLNVTANDEDSGALDVLLSLPVARWRIVLETTLAYGVMSVGISLVAFAGLMTGNVLAPIGIEVGTRRLLEGVLNFIPGAIFFLAFTVFVGALVRRRSTAATIAGVFVVASYLIDSIARAANTPAAESIRKFSVFAYYNGATVLKTGLIWHDVLLLLGMSVVLVAVAMFLFQRRDIAV